MTYSAAPIPFYNRTVELSALARAWNARTPAGQMLLLYGRRRLGKTYTLQHFFLSSPDAAPKPHCYFLADQSTAAAQRRAFAEQTLAALPDAGVSADELSVSYNQILRYISTRARDGRHSAPRFGLILDEFPYLVAQTPELPSILQSWWDREGAQAPLFVVLCGSHLSTMEALGAETAPLFGRFTAGHFALLPLRYDDVAAFYAGSPDGVYDTAAVLTMYGVLGGTPRYHALVDTNRPPEEEITDLLLQSRGALSGEINYLLTSEQIRDPAPYNAVLAAIAQGRTQFGEIADRAGTERSSLTYYLRTLTELHWIERESPFEERSDKRALYQIADPFLTFWYRFVQPLASAVAFADPHSIYRSRIEPFLPDYMGRYVFEKICHQWLMRWGAAHLGVGIEDAGRWWSRDGQTEIDMVARLTPTGYLFGECKWSVHRPVGIDVYASLVGKVQRLPGEKHRREPLYILFSVGGFTPDLIAVAQEPANRLHLIGAELLLPAQRPV